MNQDSLEIRHHPAGSGYRLEATQFLARPRMEVFEFFSDAFQLESITPGWLHFSVQTAAPIRIKRDTLIDYRLKLHGIPLRWQSCISCWEPPVRFVDEQVHGPYRRWYHEHIFEEVPGGTLCRDIVDYSVYGGRLVNSWFVQPDLRKIFAFRQQKLRELLHSRNR